MIDLLLPGLRVAITAAQLAPRIAGLLGPGGIDAAAAPGAPGAPGAPAGPAPGVPGAPGAPAPGAPAPGFPGAPAQGAPAAPGTPSTPVATGGNLPDLLLSLLVWGTLVIAAVVIFLPERTPDQRGRIRVAGVFGAGAAFLLAIFGVNSQLDAAGGGSHTYEEHAGWLGNLPLGSSYHLSVNGISLALLSISTLVFLSAMIGSLRMNTRVRLYVVLMLVLETGVNGALCSWDLLLFLLFWGMQLAPMYLLITIWGGDGRVAAARRWLGHALLAYGLLLAAAVLVVHRGTPPGLDFDALFTAGLSGGVATAAFWLLFAGFAIALGTFPLHTWLTEAHSQASAPVAAVASGALLLLPGYGLVQILLAVSGPEATARSLVIVVLAVLTTLWGALGALRQPDLRRAVGYATVAQGGAVLLGVGCHSTTATVGAVVLLAANAMAVALFHLLAGAIEERTRTRNSERLGGLASLAPRLSGIWMIGVCSAIGVPLLAGFSGELLVFTGSFPVHRVGTLVVMAAVLLTTARLLRLSERIFFGPRREGMERVRDGGTLEMWTLVPLVIGILVWGLLPGRVIPMISTGVSQDISTHIGGKG